MQLEAASRLIAQAWARLSADQKADVGLAALHWVGILLAEGRSAEAEAVAERALAQSRERRGADDLVTRHLLAAKLHAGYLQRQQAADLAALQDLAKALREAPTRRQFGQVAAWLAQALDASDPAAAERWGNEAEAALAAIFGAKHPWTRSRAGTRVLP
jgi:hypothetical protein